MLSTKDLEIKNHLGIAMFLISPVEFNQRR